MEKVFSLFYRILAYKPNISIGDAILIGTGLVALGVCAGYWIGLNSGIDICTEQIKFAGATIELMTSTMKTMLKKLYAYSI